MRDVAGDFHLTVLVESATAGTTSAGCSARPTPRPGRTLNRDPLPPVLSLESLERYSEGLVCLTGCARDGALVGSGDRGPAIAGDLRARAPAGRAAAAAVAPRSRPQPRARIPCREPRRGLRRDRQRPQPRSPPRRASGRARRRPHSHHARGVRAAAPGQLELGARSARCDGGSASPSTRRRSPRRRASPIACASTSPPRSATATPDRRIPTPTPPSPRSAAGGWRFATTAPRMRARPSAPRRGAAGDQRARALRLLPPSLRSARARPGGRGRGPRAGLGARRCCLRGAGAARASARSSAI